MNIIIIGGGEVGKTTALKLIIENHNVTIIEQDENIVNVLQNELDALIFKGNGYDIQLLTESKINKASLFIAVTSDDNANIIACSMAKKLNSNIITIARVLNAFLYFDEKNIKPNDFGVDFVIDPNQLSIIKTISLIQNPNAVEVVHYAGDKVQLVGIKVDPKFKYRNRSLLDIGKENNIFKNVRIVAIYRNEAIIIPKGKDKIRSNDKIFVIGNRESINILINTHFNPRADLKNIIIVGGYGPSKILAQELKKLGKKVTIIEEDIQKCKELAKELKNILILNGSANDQLILSEIKILNSCLVALTDNDEYNVITSVYAKRNKCAKAVSLIRNMDLVPIINSMTTIDTVFSPSILAVSEILRFCRKGNIISVASISEINAETIEISISEDSSLINLPLKKIKFPEGMIIGVIIRQDQVIIPSGENLLKLNDRVIVFILPDSLREAENIFAKKLRFRKK